MGYQFICSVFFGFTVGAVVEVDESFARAWPFWDTLLGTVGLAGLGPDLMVLFFFCDFFSGLGVMKRPETIVMLRHWFGCSLRPGKPSNSVHAVGLDGATMARKAPFLSSSIPATCLEPDELQWSLFPFTWHSAHRTLSDADQ